jgi:hypothetical protein
MTESLLDDKYDALSQGQETVDDRDVPVEEVFTDSARHINSNSKTFLSLDAIKTIFQEGICIKNQSAAKNELSMLKKSKYDNLSWQLSFEPSLLLGNTKDDSSLISLLRAKRDRYAMMNGSCISALETDISMDEKVEVTEQNVLDEMPGSDLVVDLPNFFLAIQPQSESTERFILDEKLTIEFVTEDESTDDGEIKTNGVLDKYSTTKEVTAFEKMMDRLGLRNKDGCDGRFSSNHTRTTVASTILESTGHTRTSIATVSLDAIFTLNSSIILTVHSITTEEEEEESTALNEKDDDSSAWFGFRENCNPTVAVLLAPVSSSHSEDASASLFSTDYFDTDDDEQTDALTAALESVDSDNVLRSDSDLTFVPKFLSREERNGKNASRSGLTPKAADILELILNVTEIVTPKCGGSFFGGEIEFQPSTEIDEEDAVMDAYLASTIEEERTQTLADNEEEIHVTEERPHVVDCLLQFVGLTNWNQEANEPRLCCTCNGPSEDIDDILSIMEEEEEAIESQKKKTSKQRKNRTKDGCKETSDNTSDEEGEGGIAILVEDDLSQFRTKMVATNDDHVEIILKEYMETVASVETAIRDANSSQEKNDDDTSIDTKPSEEVQSLLDHPDFKLGVIVECEHSGSEEELEHALMGCTPPNHEILQTEGDTLAIASPPSDDSFGIPTPPKEGDDRDDAFESPLDTLSCDSFVLSYSSDDMNIPLSLHSTNSMGNNRASHRRRHTLDHIPSYHALYDFKKPVVLPFLQESQSQQQQDDSFHTAKSTASCSSTSERGTLSIKTCLPDNSCKRVRPDAPTRIKNVASHKRQDASLITIWNDIYDENTPTNHSVTSLPNITPTNKSTKSGTISAATDLTKITKAPLEKKSDPSTSTPIKGILRKDGYDFGSGRRISWNEDQLASKQEKGILFYSGRDDPRSVCPLDKLVQELSKIEEP